MGQYTRESSLRVRMLTLPQASLALTLAWVGSNQALPVSPWQSWNGNPGISSIPVPYSDYSSPPVSFDPQESQGLPYLIPGGGVGSRGSDYQLRPGEQYITGWWGRTIP